MKQKKLTIIGAGPGGLILASLFSDKYQITLVEKQSNPGGCWRIHWDDGLFTEHAPKVGSGEYYEKLMTSLNVELVKTYEYPTIRFVWLFLINFTFLDWVYFTVYYIIIKLNLSNEQVYVSEWMKKFSKSAQSVIGQISILIADVPEKVLLEDYINSFAIATFYQLKDPEDWLNKLETKLRNNNVKILLNTEIKSFSKHVSRTTSNLFIPHDYLISTVPPKALHTIIQRCDDSVRYNWGNIENLLNNSFYSSIGFQMHYTQKLPDIFRKPLVINSNTVVLIHTSKYVKKFTKRPDIVDTLSCTIINQKHTIKQAIQKITDIVKIKPKMVTINYTEKSQCDSRIFSEDTAFTRQKDGTIPFKGKADNLFLVNSFNEKDISALNKTIRVCYHFKDAKFL